MGCDPAVPMVNLSLQYEEIRDEIDSAVLGVLEGGRFILGPEEKAFENEFALYTGVEHGIGVASGTDALFLVMRALGLGAGDEVLTTTFSFIATADSIARCGATPVLADIEPLTFNLDPGSMLERLTPRTKAIIAVHLYGHPADMDRIGEIAGSRGIFLIEDCAQAHGATLKGRKVGTFGTAAAFSFFPTKPLGGAGDGGMVCTNDPRLAERVRMLRAHGAGEKYIHEALGVNSRLDELQAALLRVKLGSLDRWNEARRTVAAIYGSGLEGVQTPFVAPGVEHVYHQYTVRTDRRDELKRELDVAGVGSNIYYPVPIHLQPCFKYLGYSAGDLPVSEKASKEVVSLPMYYGITPEQTHRVCEAVNEALA